MVEAFIGQVLEKIENEALLKFTQEKLNKRFNWESIVE
jgi:hypothetical protein